MKKIIALLLMLVMLVGCFASCGGNNTDADDGSSNAAAASDLAYIQGKGKIVIGITDYAPMNYKEEGSTEWTGFDTEFAQKFAEELGVEVEFIEIDWDSKQMELKSKSIDAVWNGMTITDEVKKSMDVSNAYVKNAQVVVMNKDKVADYTTADSMKGLKFAAESGSAGEEAIKDAGFENLTVVKTQALALLEVKSGSADACVIDITMANAMTGEGTSYADLAKGIELTTEEYGVAFRQGSDMVATFNNFMTKVYESGWLKTLAEKYELTLALED